MFSKHHKISTKKEEDTSLGISMFQNDVIKILRMNPAYRKEEEVQRLVDFLTFFEVFKELKNVEDLRAIAKTAEYLFVEQGNFVFQQGDMPDFFYILVKGEVAGSVKKVEGPQTKFLDEVDVIFKLAHGSAFGELALVENIPRTASLVATKASHLLLVPREEYMRTVRSHHLQLAEKNAGLLDEIKLFDNFDERKKRKFTSFCYEHTFPSGTLLLAQDAAVTKLVFVKTGIVHMFRLLRLEAVSERTRRKYAREVAATTFPVRFLAGTLGNSDYIGVNEFIRKGRAHFDYVVHIPSRAIEISTSDFVKQDDFLGQLSYDPQKLDFPDDDILLQEHFEREKWRAFQRSYSQKVLWEKRIERLDGLRASEAAGLAGEAATSEKMKLRLRRVNVGIRHYMEQVKANLPVLANTKNHVALYEIINMRNKHSRAKVGLGLNQILNAEN